MCHELAGLRVVQRDGVFSERARLESGRSRVARDRVDEAEKKRQLVRRRAASFVDDSEQALDHEVARGTGISGVGPDGHAAF